jgi:hypothetical protein
MLTTVLATCGEIGERRNQRPRAARFTDALCNSILESKICNHLKVYAHFHPDNVNQCEDRVSEDPYTHFQDHFWPPNVCPGVT